jgi:hypothetical protein
MGFAEDLPPCASDAFAPLAARWRPQGPGPWGSADPRSRNRRRGQTGLPGSWGAPRRPRRLLRPRRDRPPRPVREGRRGPRLRARQGLPRRDQFRGCMGRLGTQAVYASSGGSPRPDARLASGCWPDSTGWARRPTGLLRKVSSMLLTSLSSFPRLTLAQARGGPAHEWH